MNYCKCHFGFFKSPRDSENKQKKKKSKSLESVLKSILTLCYNRVQTIGQGFRYLFFIRLVQCSILFLFFPRINDKIVLANAARWHTYTYTGMRRWKKDDLISIGKLQVSRHKTCVRRRVSISSYGERWKFSILLCSVTVKTIFIFSFFVKNVILVSIRFRWISKKSNFPFRKVVQYSQYRVSMYVCRVSIYRRKVTSTSAHRRYCVLDFRFRLFFLFSTHTFRVSTIRLLHNI